MFRKLREDIAAIKECDPAARSGFEVLALYQGLRAVRSHRKANWFYRHNMLFLARWISQRSRRKTGIEIHPGAKLGKGILIDHGMGVVIGETAEVGDYCVIYQGVTLGGTGKDTGKRHPTIGSHCMIGAGSKILGPITVGDNCKVAANAVVLNDLPDGSTAVGVPARIVRRNGVRVCPEEVLDQMHMPDPVSQELCRMNAELDRLKRELETLRETMPEDKAV
ncbi:MAG: serine O-acetyltransferase [Clostridiales bacterium]|nr:serine O-acetyltransferase [Clostridiales bacterium]